MSVTPATRIVLVDDHPSVIEGLRAVIGQHADLLVCGWARTAATASPLLREMRPDIAILDVSLPDGDGLSWIARTMGESPKTKVILHTLHAEQDIFRNALQLGVAGYILKTSEPDSVIHAVRSVRAGGTYVDPALMSRALGRFGSQTSAQSPAQGVRISCREMETLRLTALGYGIKEIAEEFKVSTKSIETYKVRASEKLGLKSRSAIVRHAIANGWFSTFE